jgi:hypothetical protein
VKSVRFCPKCGAERIEGAQFCANCGADLEAYSTSPVPSAPEAEPEQPLVARPPEAATSPVAVRSAADESRPVGVQRPTPRGPLLFVGLLVVVLIVAGGAVGAALLLTASSPPGPVAGTPFPSPVALTSPSTSQVPAGLADPSTPAYQVASGFTPDAVRVLTVTVFQLSLSRFYADTGRYPTTLDALFPTYAPPGPDGTPMTTAPSVVDGYTYTTTGSAYTLSVALASGQSYTVRGP